MPSAVQTRAPAPSQRELRFSATGGEGLRWRCRPAEPVSRDAEAWLHAELPRGSAACGDVMTVNTTRAGAFTEGFVLYTCRCWKRTKSDSFLQRCSVDERFLLVRVSARTCNKELPAPTGGRFKTRTSVSESPLPSRRHDAGMAEGGDRAQRGCSFTFLERISAALVGLAVNEPHTFTVVWL